MVRFLTFVYKFAGLESMAFKDSKIVAIFQYTK